MTNDQLQQDRPELITAPATRYPSGEIVTHWDGPPAALPPREGREAEFRRAERLMAIGIGQLQEKPQRLEVARRCFHAATCLYAWALGAERRLAFAWDRLGYVHHVRGNDDEAESCYLRSLAIQERARQAFTAWNEVTQLNLAIIYRTTGRRALDRAVLGSYDADAKPNLPGVVRPAPCRRPPRGHSAHGLRFADVIAAFRQAERELGANWVLSGRGHCRRVTLDARYSRVLSPAIRSCAVVSPHSASSSRILFPRALVERAAEILHVDPQLIIGKEY
ncbi:MAG: tetratricopeptide repeat protein [Gemmatimonadales bacterium]|nr:tetratricopeptide repeat protein [Gemmatimonadales bacterium]